MENAWNAPCILVNKMPVVIAWVQEESEIGDELWTFRILIGCLVATYSGTQK